MTHYRAFSPIPSIATVQKNHDRELQNLNNDRERNKHELKNRKLTKKVKNKPSVIIHTQMKKRVREGSVTRLMEQILSANQKAKAKPRAHNALTMKASEAEIDGDASAVEVFDAVVTSLVFSRRSMDENRSLEVGNSKTQLRFGLGPINTHVIYMIHLFGPIK